MGEKRKEKIKELVAILPEQPGSYQFYDEKGVIIYVGKAKNIKKRVASYFNKENKSVKTNLLVSKICDIAYTIVHSEHDALLLENALIKQYQPRYNVLLKDDKSYPYIAVTKEYLPRIFATRNLNKGLANYYGPYTHLPTMYALLDLCAKLYKPRSCQLAISELGIRTGKYELCLDYHIKKCDAPCVGYQDVDRYRQNIEACRNILRGKTKELSLQLLSQMRELAEEMQFEVAAELKRKYDLIEAYRAKSEIVSNVHYDIDVFAIESEEQWAYINFLHVVEGTITQSFTFEFRKKLAETDEELLALGIVEMRNRFQSTSPEIVVPFRVDLPESYAEQFVPQSGGKKKLLELSLMNVKQYKLDKLKRSDQLNASQKQIAILVELQKKLGLPNLPKRIEMFDNSNLAGEDAVAACVVFENAQPLKQEYRHFNIKTVVGADDYASMREVVERRYGRLVAEKAQLPQLIVADGGVGQMNAICEVLQKMNLDIAVVGLVKDAKHRTRELLFGTPPSSVAIKRDSLLFRFLEKLQNEVHRFAIGHHRKKRAKRQVASQLDEITGLGPKGKAALLLQLGSVERVLAAEERVLQEILGRQKGAKIYAQLHLQTGVSNVEK